MLIEEEVATILAEMSLADRIRQILIETTEADPARIARLLLAQTRPEDYFLLLEAALPAYVRVRISAERALTTPQAASGVLTRSAKVTGIQEWWRQVLEDRIHTGGGYRRLGDCNWYDLDYAASALRNSAETLLGKARRYEALRDRLDVHNLDVTVGTLGKEAIEAFLGDLPES